MADVNKVIKGLEHCTRPSVFGTGGNFCMDCPYVEPIGFNQFKCNGKQMKKDALELLKNLISVEPELEGDPGNGYWWVCGECHGSISRTDRFCRHCGRKVLQECLTN